MNEPQSPLRLRKKHGSGAPLVSTAMDGKRLVDAQSVRNAIVAGLITIAVFSVLWVLLSELTSRVYPWLTVILGFMLGHSIRLAGRGVDARFPVLAAGLTLFGSLLANIVVAASVTADENNTSTLQVLASVTTMTWPVFFEEALTIADGFYAIFAASVAAFYANRRLTRSQYHALRLWNEERRRE
ncbi:MAG: hypothetical protein OEY74_01980 [Gammaproteobacteria bacterium]|nr:hypothetical protein [Gammaproteobacteria bacterium]